MMKKIVLFLTGLTICMSAWTQEPRVDTVAVMIIDRMATVIGELNSCSFTLNTTMDVNDPDFGLIKRTWTDEVYLVGPDKMHLQTHGDKGNRGFWYNGWQAVTYSFDENNFATIEAPDNLIAMIDTINHHYGIEFPAADFFYPTFTDDLLANFDTIVFLGKKKLNGRECFHILVSNQAISVQMWFTGDAFTLPQQFVIRYKNEENRQYEATFSNWQLNPEIPAAVFEFTPPPAAREVSILPRYKR
ncbi:MAG TPA: DUF2092 domain-containing protein [Bacteroidales bacterium]|nr:DUF2092 domain-containing protein [Bacteroidales bacterium]HNS46176.1 DUF2092 domain-containing protein [Bacteroidales bacterium]